MGQQMSEQAPGTASEVQGFGPLDEALFSADLVEGSSGLLTSANWNGRPEPSPRPAPLPVENMAWG